jgi:hypothetical protein
MKTKHISLFLAFIMLSSIFIGIIGMVATDTSTNTGTIVSTEQFYKQSEFMSFNESEQQWCYDTISLIFSSNESIDISQLNPPSNRALTWTNGYLQNTITIE